MATVEVEVEVDLDDFDDDEIREEYEARGLGDRPSASEDTERLEAIYHQMRLRKSRAAYKLMYDYIRDKLGRAV